MDGESGRSMIAAEVIAIAARAKAAAATLALVPAPVKQAALRAAAVELRAATEAILAANATDIAAVQARGDASASFIDRLTLTPARIAAMAAGIDLVAGLPDPVGRELARWQQPNGLDIARVAVPLGVIGIIYESRPNVTADAGALCVKAGNAAILRGGSESFHSSSVIINALRRGLESAGVPADAIQGIPTVDREAVGVLLQLDAYIDVIIPRGGQNLIRRVAAESRIPVLKHLDGNCHVYLHTGANHDTAVAVVRNAKLRRVSVCGAAESLLVDRAVAPALLPAVLGALQAGGCEIRGDAQTQAIMPGILAASEADWSTEYLEAVISVKIVDGLDAAITHINKYGSHHTDAIVTEDEAAAERFLLGIDSAIVLRNASTQFADGGEFGFGAEIGISTGRLHARGPVGAEQLTSYKYLVRGSGQIRA